MDVRSDLEMRNTPKRRSHYPRARTCAAVLVFAMSMAMPHAHAQTLRFAPIDEAAADLGWQAYKNRLLEALEARDRAVVLTAIDPQIDNGPDEKRGIEAFRRRWDFDDDKSPIWNELRKAVILGGAFVKDEKGQIRFCAPYVAAKWPTTVDPFKFGAVVSRDVLVKSAPSSESRTLATLTHEVVPVEDWEVADQTAGFPQKWTKIRVRDVSGFIPEEQIRSPIEHMACFSGRAGPWRLTSFTAGYLPE